MLIREDSPLDGGSLPGRGWRRPRGWRVYGGKVSEGGIGGEEESRLDRSKPQVDGGEGSRVGWAGEEMVGGVRGGIAVGADVDRGSAYSV